MQHLSKPRPTSSIPFGKGATGFVAILLPLSATLPSPEARAHGSAAPRSPSLRAGTLGSPGPSTSDLGVRALKSLYTVPWQRYHVYQRQRQRCLRRAAQSGPGHTLRSPVVDGGGSGPGTFRVEAFALCVQALIADDRALMECLIRLAQAHDLLKKNVERAQKRATPRLRCTSARCARSRSSSLARTVCTRLSPSSRTAGMLLMLFVLAGRSRSINSPRRNLR
ncbi:hypothetical protein EDB83DRAFT_448359 [Lactarius deliciosus]|nr:hypothetical protein EDB83DRAFT_448359 [Lactarius deliciosus]